MKELKINFWDDGKITCFLRKSFLNYYEEISVDEAKKILEEYGVFRG